MFITKVVLGKVRYVTQFNEVMACPPGYDSVRFRVTYRVGYTNSITSVVQVVFHRYNGKLNETVVYKDQAIKPVFLVCFSKT
jgi:hypothetical protein